MKQKINRLMLAGTGSGCGKTTITCAILGALQQQGITTAAFKCGPDYIDPMFHSIVTGVSCVNIDPFLCGEDAVQYLFAKNSKGAAFSLIEGVMGFYDGLGGISHKNSAYHISELLCCPVVLVINCKGVSLSIAATIQGYQSLYPNRIQGVILNHVSAATYPMYQQIIQQHTNVVVLGYLPNIPEAILESRHLGLVTAGELDGLTQKLQVLADTAKTTINIAALLALGQSAPVFSYKIIAVATGKPVTIALAMDKAFCFYYADSLHLLERMGVKLIPFSPLTNNTLPPHISGIIFGGGYPELYLQQLSHNHSMLTAIQTAHKNGMPIYGECGGFLYLGSTLNGVKLASLIPMHAHMTTRLQNFGYISLTAKRRTGLLQQGECIPAHEFHYSVSDTTDFCLTATKYTGKSWQGGYQNKNLFALYPHLHFYGCMNFAQRFVDACRIFQKEQL